MKQVAQIDFLFALISDRRMNRKVRALVAPCASSIVRRSPSRSAVYQRGANALSASLPLIIRRDGVFMIAEVGVSFGVRRAADTPRSLNRIISMQIGNWTAATCINVSEIRHEHTIRRSFAAHSAALAVAAERSGTQPGRGPQPNETKSATADGCDSVRTARATGRRKCKKALTINGNASTCFRYLAHSACGVGHGVCAHCVRFSTTTQLICCCCARFYILYREKPFLPISCIFG